MCEHRRMPIGQWRDTYTPFLQPESLPFFRRIATRPQMAKKPFSPRFAPAFPCRTLPRAPVRFPPTYSRRVQRQNFECARREGWVAKKVNQPWSWSMPKWPLVEPIGNLGRAKRIALPQMVRYIRPFADAEDCPHRPGVFLSLQNLFAALCALRTFPQ
jgi:hypothetical protein